MKTATPALHVPAALAERPNWIVWKSIRRGDHATKIPFSPLDLHLASTTEPKRWGTLHQAQTALATRDYAGLGFVFKRGDGIFGVDLDSCFRSLFDLEEWAASVINTFGTYAEVSPSGFGVKLFGIGKHDSKGTVKVIDPPSAGTKRAAIEVYGWGRFFAFTGARLENSPLELAECQAKLSGLIEILKPTPAASPATRPATRPAVDSRSPLERGRLYLAKVPGAVQGQQGNSRTFRVAYVLVRLIGLSLADAFTLMWEWNDRCDPPWTEKELWQKLNSAQKAK